MATQRIQPGTPPAPAGFLRLMADETAPLTPIGDLLNIGRDPGCDLKIHDDFVSARHARLERKDDGFLLRDMRSRNGTYLNGMKILESYVTQGDRIRIGKTELLFCNQNEDTSAQPFVKLSSQNQDWCEQLERLPSIAESDLTVLLTGPSGSGKEVLAQTIHRLSRRNNGPFVSVNCSALSESLVESELFGHLRGSFTGATGDRQGAFETARRGTLFLDEVGDLPLSLQPKLLRALENRQIRPVGSDHTKETDVRVIAATHQNLRQKVADGSFRQDLYFRLNIVNVKSPALVDRIEDFNDLFYRFAKLYRISFSFAAIEKLKTHSWPGNIRELKNVVARAKAYFPQRQVQVSDLNQLLDIVVHKPPRPAPLHPERSIIKDIEYEMIRSRLIANKGNQRRTALDLGLAKSTLHDRIQAYGIDVTDLLREAGI